MTPTARTCGVRCRAWTHDKKFANSNMLSVKHKSKLNKCTKPVANSLHYVAWICHQELCYPLLWCLSLWIQVEPTTLPPQYLGLTLNGKWKDLKRTYPDILSDKQNNLYMSNQHKCGAASSIEKDSLYTKSLALCCCPEKIEHLSCAPGKSVYIVHTHTHIYIQMYIYVYNIYMYRKTACVIGCSCPNIWHHG